MTCFRCQLSVSDLSGTKQRKNFLTEIERERERGKKDRGFALPPFLSDTSQESRFRLLPILSFILSLPLSFLFLSFFLSYFLFFSFRSFPIFSRISFTSTSLNFFCYPQMTDYFQLLVLSASQFFHWTWVSRNKRGNKRGKKKNLFLNWTSISWRETHHR